MSSKKTSIQRGKIPSYIKTREPDGDLVQISVRIPTSEKNRFESAQQILRANGFDMDLTRVIRCALADAADYVEMTHTQQSDTDRPTMRNGDAGPVPEASVEAFTDARDE